ncbi:MAG: hypothetical protein ACEQSB_03345 [Undibacterium sp.]
MNFPLSFARMPWLTALSGLALGLLLALTLALFGWFFPALTLLALGLILGGFSIALFAFFQSKDYVRLLLIGSLSLLTLVTTFSAEPSLFTGRDQGSIGIAAWNLAENHELAFRTAASDAFFQIYGPGRALNFPGFSYTDTGALLTQFPLGYTSYLALFVSWLGQNGLLIGNAFLFVLSGWSFFELALLFLPRRSALFATILLSTSFATLWLSRLALTENLALLLYLVLTGAMVRIDRERDRRFLPLVILTGFLLALTRIEGFAIAGLALGWILFRPELRALLFGLPKRWFIPSLLFFAFLFLRDLFINVPFYTMIAKAGIKYWNELSSVAVTADRTEPALGPILFSYGLFPIFLFGIAALLFGFMKRRYTLFIPLLLAAPTLIYLINGHISDDHPWLLRRYIFTLFPLFLLATACLIEEVGRRFKNPWKDRVILIAFGILFLLQSSSAVQVLRTHEQAGLLEQAAYLGTLFTDHDLILIDRGASGDPFALIAGPLSVSGKNAVYFFNPEDYARLDRSKFEHVYLLTAEDALGRYAEVFGDRLLPIQTVSFDFASLAAPTPYALPEAKQIQSDAILFQITE